MEADGELVIPNVGVAVSKGRPCQDQAERDRAEERDETGDSRNITL